MWYDVFNYLYIHLGEIASLITIILTIGGMIRSSYKRLHADIQEIRNDLKESNKRMDAMNQRIDGVYQFLMKQYENPKTNP